MKQAMMCLIVTFGLTAQVAAVAGESADSCNTHPYVGGCPQGCDVIEETEDKAMTAAAAGEKMVTVQVNCEANPYLGPLCDRPD